MDKFLGIIFLATYIIAVGVGSFLQKFVMGKVTPYQLEVITAIGMFCVSVPALLFAQKSLNLPIKEAPLSLLVGLLFAIGSFVYVLAVSRLPVNVAAPVSTGYVVIAVVLSTLFLKEPITLLKGIGIILTVVGVAILSL
jgi:drug/metabolite transporter (DMT)-like permease